MSIYSRIFGDKPSPPPPIIEPVETKDFGTTSAFADNAFGWSVMAGPYGPSHSGLNVNPVSSLQVGTVFSCVSILVGDLAKLPFRLMRENKEGIWLEDRKHPLARLLRKPNRRMTQADFITHIVMSILLTGNSYVAVIRDPDGRPIELIPLIPNTVSIREDGEGALFYMCFNRLFKNNQVSRTFAEEDMIHVRGGISLDGGIRGSGPNQLAGEVLGLGMAVQQLCATMFMNGAHFQGLLKTEQGISKEQVEQISNAWNAKDKNGLAGVSNSYRTPVLPLGLEFQPIQQDNTQIQMVEIRRLIVEECARLYKIPLQKLSTDGGKLGYASIDAQNQDYVDGTLIPLANPIEQTFAKVLLFDREFDDFKFEFDFNSLERGDIKTRTEHQHTMLTDGVYSVNDVLKQMNLPSIGPEGDIRTKPLNTGVVGNTEALPQFQVDAPLKETESVQVGPDAGSDKPTATPSKRVKRQSDPKA